MMTVNDPEIPKAHYRDNYHLQMHSSPENYWLYGYMAALGTKSAFEFGCNAGRHLKQLQTQNIKVAGIDVNPRAVTAAKHINKVAVQVGDEKALADIGTATHDVVFTVSVLTHMPSIDEVLDHLFRIAKHHVLLVETQTRTDANNYWWQHNYPGTSVYSYYGKQVNAVYQIWHVRK